MTNTTTNAKTAALEALIEAHAVELKLPTVKRRYRALADEAVRAQQTPVAYLAALLEAEMAERAERRERRQRVSLTRSRDCLVGRGRRPQGTSTSYAGPASSDDRPATRSRSLRASIGALGGRPTEQWVAVRPTAPASLGAVA